MVDRIANIWGTRTPYARDGLWPVRVDQALDGGVAESDVDRWVQSACALCSNGCACDIAVKDGAMVGIRGPAGDLVDHGRLRPKGLFAGWQGVSHRDRRTVEQHHLPAFTFPVPPSLTMCLGISRLMSVRTTKGGGRNAKDHQAGSARSRQ